MQYTIRHTSPSQGRHAGSFVFVVSHMRSYSSLLCHILGSHAEISGYAEMHKSYFGRTDLNRLATKVRAATGNPDLGRYVLDKILHNHLQIAPSILDRPDVKVVFLIRSPEDTITSILEMSRAMGHCGEFSSPEQVLGYYLGRLRQIEAYSEQLGRNALLIDAQRLIVDTAATLDGLAQWLDLDGPLTAEYRTFKFTGKPGYGDPSPNILAGTIVADASQRRRDHVPVPVPEDVLLRARAGHATSWETLASRSDVR